MRTTDETMRWVWRGSALGAVLIGWMFILFHNNFHITPATVFIGLGFTAGVCTIYALFKVGAAIVAPESEDFDPEIHPETAREELEREKKTLLKAIKEAEFDHQMGKLSNRDVEEMIRNYRLRAIEVIKLLEGGQDATPREQIEREVRARLEIEAVRGRIERAHADVTTKKKGHRAAAAAQAAARSAAAAGASAAVVQRVAAAAAARAELEEREAPEPKSDAKPDAKPEAKPDDKLVEAADAKPAPKAAELVEAAEDKPAPKAAAKADKADKADKIDTSEDKPAPKADDTVKADTATQRGHSGESEADKASSTIKEATS